MSLPSLVLPPLAILLLLMSSTAPIILADAFQQPNILSSSRIASIRLENQAASYTYNHHLTHSQLYSISNDNNNENDDDASNNDNEEEADSSSTNNIFAALPAIGTSSFWDRQQDDNTTNNNNLQSHNIVVSRKLHLSYTCKPCSTRNTHTLTRLGYNHGVVIAICKHCQTKHLIADNLGWSNYLVSGFDYEGGERNIEEWVRRRVGEEESGGLRVEKGVFDLENLWYMDEERMVESGSGLVEEDGEDWS